MVRHVLLVETGSAAGARLRRPLRLLGYRVQIVHEGAHAAAQALRCRAELVLLGSADLCRAMKVQPGLAGLPVVLYAPDGLPGGLQVEPEAVLSDPVEPASVWAAVERALAVK